MKRKGLHDDSNRKKRRQRCRQRCGHCQQFLSNSQFHEHRRLYFNSSLNQWKTVEHARKSSFPEDVPGSSSNESEGELIKLNSSSAYSMWILHTCTSIICGMIMIVDEKSIVIIWQIYRTSIKSKLWLLEIIEFDRFLVLVFQFIKAPIVINIKFLLEISMLNSTSDDIRTRDMINQVEFSWYFNKFTPVHLQEKYWGSNKYWLLCCINLWTTFPILVVLHPAYCLTWLSASNHAYKPLCFSTRLTTV